VSTIFWYGSSAAVLAVADEKARSNPASAPTSS
jgi:hypothetical protein